MDAVNERLAEAAEGSPPPVVIDLASDDEEGVPNVVGKEGKNAANEPGGDDEQPVQQEKSVEITSEDVGANDDGEKAGEESVEKCFEPEKEDAAKLQQEPAEAEPQQEAAVAELQQEAAVAEPGHEAARERVGSEEAAAAAVVAEKMLDEEEEELVLRMDTSEEQSVVGEPEGNPDGSASNETASERQPSETVGKEAGATPAQQKTAGYIFLSLDVEPFSLGRMLQSQKLFATFL